MKKKTDSESAATSAQLRVEEPEVGDGRFKLAFEKSPIGLAVVDSSYRLLSVNKSLCDTLGYEAQELVGRKFVDFTHPDDVGRDKALADKLFSGEISNYRLEKRFLTKHGDIAWLDLTALLIRADKNYPAFGLAMGENITDRKRTHEALRTSEERYRSFVVNSSEGIWRLEAEQSIDTTLSIDEQVGQLYKYGYLAECNDVFARMCGHSRADDITGARFGELALASNPVTVASVRKLIKSDYRLTGLKTEQFAADSSKKYFSTNLIGIVINNQLLRIWGVQTDLTQQKNAEIKLERSRQQLRALSSYLQNVRERERTDLAREIHDTLGQSLTGIRIELSLLIKRISDQQPGSEVTAQLIEISKEIAGTINSVKTLSTELRPGVLDKFGLAAAIEWQCVEFAKRFHIRCQCVVPDQDLTLSSQVATALFRILQEALTNVARHSGATKVDVSLTVAKDNVSLVVSDDGSGITVAELNAPSSLGLLGMSERAGALRGTLSIKGKVHAGTVVTVSVPLNATLRAET